MDRGHGEPREPLMSPDGAALVRDSTGQTMCTVDKVSGKYKPLISCLHVPTVLVRDFEKNSTIMAIDTR